MRSVRVTEAELLSDQSEHATAIHGFGFSGTLAQCVDHVADAYGRNAAEFHLARLDDGAVMVRSRKTLLMYCTIRKVARGEGSWNLPGRKRRSTQ